MAHARSEGDESTSSLNGSSKRGLSLSGLVLAIIAVLSVSTSASLIRLAGDITAYEIAFWRLLVAVTVLTPPMVATGAWEPTRKAGARSFFIYGAILAAHFITYNLALRYAPIAHVLPLAYTSIIFVAILSAIFFNERLSARQVAGIAVVMAGIVVLAGFDPRLDARVIFGDLLAIATAIAFALYALAARRERARVPLLGYAVGVYAFAALWIAPLAILFTRGGYSWNTVGAVVALGVIPGAVGHTLFNASVRRLNATVANVIFTQEISVGILLGWVVVGEAPTLNAALGAGIMLAGIVAVLLPSPQRF